MISQYVSLLLAQGNTCPLFFRVIFACFLKNIFYSEGDKRNFAELLDFFVLLFFLVIAVCNCFEELIFYSIIKFCTSTLP